MKDCRISDRWTLNGLQTIVMENELLRTSVLVDLGARIHEFIFKPLDRDFFWHSPRIEPRAPVFQADIDNWLSGGMDEAIPTGHPSTYKNETYPYIGELWSLRWDYDIVQRGPQEVEVHLWRYAPISPLRVDRWMLLRSDEAVLHMRHRVSNLSHETFDFLWGLHPCWDVRETTRFDIPAGEMLIEDSAPNDRLGAKGTRYQWPFATEAATGRPVDVRLMPPANVGTGEFQFATQLNAGWLAVTDTRMKAGAGLVFPHEIFKAAWLWTCAGNWRGYYVGALEAWTGYPQKLHDAVDHGVYYSLPGNQAVECETALVAYQGVGSVSYLGLDGTVKE